MRQKSPITIGEFATADGDISYYRTQNPQSSYDMLFIHGIGEDKNWFPEQFEKCSLGEVSWLVPDLLGFGESSKPQRQDAYTMSHQAELLEGILDQEGVTRLVVLAHSMGGPIAVSLIESLSLRPDIEVLGLFYLEGNLDINDAYLSGKFAAHTYEAYTQVFKKRLDRLEEANPELYESTRAIGPFPFWASSVDLVRESGSGDLLPRIQKQQQLPTHFVFGLQNKGRFSSEALVRDAGLPLHYVPDAGHMMYLDNPTAFWPIVFEALSAPQ